MVQHDKSTKLKENPLQFIYYHLKLRDKKFIISKLKINLCNVK